MEKEVFLMKPKHQCHLSQRGEWLYGAQSWKKKRLLYESVYVLVDKWTLTLKNGGTRSFSYETKASTSFVPMRRMCLWSPIMKRKEITMWTLFIPIDKWTLTLKNNERSFSYLTKTLMSFTPTRRMSLWCQIMKRKAITIRIHVCSNWQINFNSKNDGKRSFSCKTKASMHLS